MKKPPLSPDEPFRLDALRRLNLVDSPIEERFERVTRMAQRMLGTPIAAISLVETDRQWFKSIQGLDCAQTDRDVAFCAYTILDDEALVVPDARLDDRFSQNPLVTGEPFIVFYAGVPLHSACGARVGSLCVIDDEPRELSDEDIETLKDLAAIAASELRNPVSEDPSRGVSNGRSSEQRQRLIDNESRLWNREGIYAVTCKMLHAAAGGESGAAVALLQINNIDQIRASHGSAGVDDAVRLGAKRVLSAIRSTDAVGRIEGDEFMVALSPCESPEVAAELAQQLCERLDGVKIGDGAHAIGILASAGVVYVPAGNQMTVEDVVADADLALGTARSNRRVVSAHEIDLGQCDAA